VSGEFPKTGRLLGVDFGNLLPALTDVRVGNALFAQEFQVVVVLFIRAGDIKTGLFGHQG